MGVAKAGLEASVKYLAADLGPEIRVNGISARPDQDAGGKRHRRLPLVMKWNEYNSPSA